MTAGIRVGGVDQLVDQDRDRVAGSRSAQSAQAVARLRASAWDDLDLVFTDAVGLAHMIQRH